MRAAKKVCCCSWRVFVGLRGRRSRGIGEKKVEVEEEAG